MCQSPITLPNGQVVACHRCPQCIDLAINDWVGRNIAESKTSIASHAVTLTYGRVDNEVLHERAVLLTYSDPQKYLKLLRRHGYSVRYFITGEFGGLKGRTHWHIVLHWQTAKIPEHVIGKRFNEAHWLDEDGASRGFSFWQKADYTTLRYNCKYIMKDQGDDERQGHLAMSKKPPLGAKYFAKLAWKYVEQGIAPQALDYNFPGVVYEKGEKKGQRRQFRLTGRSAQMFLEEFIARWEIVYPGRDIPRSEVIEKHYNIDNLIQLLSTKGWFKAPPFKGALTYKTTWQMKTMDDWQQEFERYWNGKQEPGREGRAGVEPDQQQAPDREQCEDDDSYDRNEE